MLINVVPINIFKADLDLSTESGPEMASRSAWSRGMLFKTNLVRRGVILAKIDPPAGRRHSDGGHVSVVRKIQIRIKIDTWSTGGCTNPFARARRRPGSVEALNVSETIRRTSDGFGT